MKEGDGYLGSLSCLPRVAGEVHLLLGTDRHIGERENEPETRVALTPSQLGELRAWCKTHGILLNVSVVANAGKFADFPDEQYKMAGCNVVPEEEIHRLNPAPTVVVALKEPTAYEGRIPGPFLRIGALHSGEHLDTEGGLAALLRAKNIAAVFDGSETGHHAHVFRGGERVPIRACMSVFAGRWAADQILNRTSTTSGATIVISGGGAGGAASAAQCLTATPGAVARVIILEPWNERVGVLRERFQHDRRLEVINTAQVTREILEGVFGLVLIASLPDKGAPKVVSTREIAAMAVGGAVIDISADEGGSVECNGSPKEAVEKLGRSLAYVADTHVPRNYPREASDKHGQEMVPYLAVLLYLAAAHGGADGAAEFLLSAEGGREPRNMFSGIVRDLRHGLMVRGPFPYRLGHLKNVNEVMAFVHKLDGHAKILDNTR